MSVNLVSTTDDSPKGNNTGSIKSRIKTLILLCGVVLVLLRSQGMDQQWMRLTLESLEELSFAQNLTLTFSNTTSVTTTTKPPTMAPTPKYNPNGGGLFFCGYNNHKLGVELFPDYAWRFEVGYDHDSHEALQTHHAKRFPTKKDLLVYGMHGECANQVNHFPGKVLFVNGEPFGYEMPRITQLAGRRPAKDVYQIGLVADSPFSVKMYHGAWNLLRIDESLWPTLWDHSRKPKNSGKYLGAAYMSRQCHKHREDAVNAISHIMTIYYGGACRGDADKQQQDTTQQHTRFLPMPYLPEVAFWSYNRDAYSEYKFCMALENSAPKNYMSEKIIIAFLSGCVPIYFGSEEVFDVFNAKSFVFYDPNNPQPALERLQILVNNETAYQEVLDAPIMANGTQSVRDYFSFSDRIGGGYLKKKLRKKMRLPEA